MKNRFTGIEFSCNKRKKLPPLRSLKEMAEEFGVSLGELRGFIAHRHGPQPVQRSKSIATTNSWFNPKEMRDWWASIGFGK